MGAAPTGLGIWRGPRQPGTWLAPGIGAAITATKAIGATWIAPRAGIDGLNDPSFKLEHVAAYKSAGLACYPWMFTRPSTWPGFIPAAKLIIDAGADGLIVDAEQAWDVDANGSYDAMQFAAALRTKLGPDAWIADAPWPWLGKHPTFPAAEFAPAVDARLPQAYATEIGTTVPKCLAETDREWSEWEARFSAYVRPRYPILTTYPKVTPLVIAEVLAALDAYGTQPISLYSLEAMTAELYMALVERASLRVSPPPTLPAPPDPFDPAAHGLQIDAQKLKDEGEGDG